MSGYPAAVKVIDHIAIGVGDLARSRAFYVVALAPLGFSERGSWSQLGREFAFGLPGAGDFAISTIPPVAPGMHVAFKARRRDQVDAFHAAALAAGATDNGPPGLRPEYSEHYYGAFVLDPDGYNIEAVCTDPPEDDTIAPQKRATAPSAVARCSDGSIASSWSTTGSPPAPRTTSTRA
jgi:catechol 2,3-dioxygenase-like lactoylglutathione lyase family enzyme